MLFDLTNPAVLQIGAWGYGYYGSQRCIVPGIVGVELRLTITGTDCTIACYVNSLTPSMQVSIDGGAFVNLPSPSH